jgi:N-acetylglutamate synthase/N-acetylornithine aminotransferase
MPLPGGARHHDHRHRAEDRRPAVGVAPRIVGVAKGVGMIEPDMATMIAMFFTDAAVSAPALDAVFRRVIDRTFNCVSVDTDTSTSDTAVILANGAAGPVDDDAEFEAALYEVAESLTKQIARDGEGPPRCWRSPSTAPRRPSRRSEVPGPSSTRRW